MQLTESKNYSQPLEHEAYTSSDLCNAIDIVDTNELVHPHTWAVITGIEPQHSLIEVILPVHNEAQVIRACIRNIQAQIVPEGARIKIVVSDNASTDNTADVVAELQTEASKTSTDIQYVYSEKQGKGHAVNQARKLLETDLAISVDVDAYPTPATFAKLFALMNFNPQLVAVTPMAKRITRERTNFWTNFEDTYMGMTRVNGAILGMCYILRNNKFPEIPLTTASDDTWIEYYAISEYGINSVGFLGQDPHSDVATMYYGIESAKFLKLLLRWESSFQILMEQYPDFWEACHQADRCIPPNKFWELKDFLSSHFPEIPLRDQLTFYYSLNLIRYVTRFKAMQKIFGPKGGVWVSPERAMETIVRDKD